MARIKPKRMPMRAATKVVPKTGRCRKKLWHLDWLQHVAASPFYVESGKLYRKSTGRPVKEEFI